MILGKTFTQKYGTIITKQYNVVPVLVISLAKGWEGSKPKEERSALNENSTEYETFILTYTTY